MIEVTILKDSKQYKGLSILGHAGAGEYGKDIVCAAVSVLVINTINSIDTLTNDKIKVKSNDKKGFIELTFLSSVSLESKVLMDSLVLGLQGVRDDNNTEYINIIFKEV